MGILLKDHSVDILRSLLNHSSLLVKIKTAEILSVLNDGVSKSKRERILDCKFGIEKDYEFLSVCLNRSMNIMEIPLLFISVNTIDVKFRQENRYELGITDSNIHICPSVGAPGTRMGYLNVPLKEVVALGKQKEQVTSKFRKSYWEAQGIEFYMLVIRCKSKMVDPNNLTGRKTKALIFRIDLGYEERVDMLIKILPILREGSLKKKDIFQKFFNEDNINHIKQPGHIF